MVPTRCAITAIIAVVAVVAAVAVVAVVAALLVLLAIIRWGVATVLVAVVPIARRALVPGASVSRWTLASGRVLVPASGVPGLILDAVTFLESYDAVFESALASGNTLYRCEDSRQASFHARDTIAT